MEPGRVLEVPAETAHHLIRVLRHRDNDPVRVFNGCGSEWHGTLLLRGKKDCGVHILAALPDTPEPVAVHMGLALLKGDAMDRAVQKCVELGVTSIDLLITDHCSVRRDSAQESRRQAHLQRIIIAACEQSGERHMPSLTGPTDLDRWIDSRREVGHDQIVALDPGGVSFPPGLPRVPTSLLTGPEGGWSESELALFEKAAIHLCRLGTRILRAETAPLVALAALRQGWNWSD